MQQPSNETTNFTPSIQLHSTSEPLQIRQDASFPQAIEYFPPFKNEWNTNPEILNIILAANADPSSSCIKTQSSPRPCSGAQFIFPRLDGSWFKNDGYIWRKRNNGRNIREDHLKLKVRGHTQTIEAKYVHSAIVPTFHRRVYFLPDSSHVLVHYLNEKSDQAEQAEEIAKMMINNNIFISLQQLHEQLSPIFYQSADQLVIEVNEHLRKKGVNLPTSPLPQEPPTTPTPTARELERRNSCSSAFRKGLSSVALRRQPSANSEIDANHIGTMLKRFGCNGSSNDKISIVAPAIHNFQSIRSHHNHQAMESRSPSGDGDSRGVMPFDEDASYQQLSIRSSTNGSTPASAFAEKMKIRSGSQESPMGGFLIPIIEMSPSSSSLKGGQKLLVIGGYYRKGHDYKISFGRGRMMAASLIHAGVLSCVIPPALQPEVVQVRVFCNGQPVSTAAEFTYEQPPEHLQKENDEKLMQIFEKIRIMACAFNAYSSVENIQSSSCMESLLTNLVQQIDSEITSQSHTFKMELLNGSSQFPSKTVLHLVASFDYDRLFEALIDLRRKVPACRELDILARDSDGSTPLHTACRHLASRTARLIMSIDGSTINVMDDRGRTPAEVGPDDSIDMLSDKNNEEERVNATELWVMTNGKAFTSENLLNDGKISRIPIAEKTDDLMREATSSYSIMSEMYEGAPSMLQAGNSRECDEDCTSCCDANETGQLHVEIAMDTDVHVPDSPKMARLFQAVTSPGIAVTPNARALMADLARHIIEALPDRIKRNSEASTFPDEEEQQNQMLNNNGMGVDSIFYQPQPSCSMSVDSPNLMDDYIEMMAAETAKRNGMNQATSGDGYLNPGSESTLLRCQRTSGDGYLNPGSESTLLRNQATSGDGYLNPGSESTLLRCQRTSGDGYLNPGSESTLLRNQATSGDGYLNPGSESTLSFVAQTVYKFTEPRSTETIETTSTTTRSAQLFATNFFDDRSFASSSTRANTFESDTLDFDKDLGEFFTHHVDRFVDPIQQRLANLKYNG
ncbi:hypothetical protein GCK72_004494 [Caenorhabditis remanei]|uniref:CG-1 domain-containing protein n=1 Tax=Caenorhabditis remanei TaxID=31234 RepID=A0A6A5HBD2_CAERE|nr:hypothetical protein GCK72_004494 [Caenorhabditis remanei]KAF1764545.1 hypothetical protein GCK72_004494 [Caenorhabditis remanei]